MTACVTSRAIAAFRSMSYIVVVLIPACLPALGCRSDPPEPPDEVKSQAVDPEKEPIETMIEIPDNIEDLQEVDPNKLNVSPKETGTPPGEPAKEK